MDALIGTFHIDWKLIVAQLVNFAIVFSVLYWFAFKPLGKLMRERGDRIDKGLKDAVLNEQLVAEARKVYEALLARGREEAHVLIQTMKREVEATRQVSLTAVQAEAGRILEEGKERLREEKNVLLKEAEKEIASLVVTGVEKILRRHVDTEIQRDSIIKSVASLK